MITISTASYLPHQKEFFFCQDRVKGLIGGLGSGKTYVFTRETLKHHLLSFNPKTNLSKGWIIYPTYGLAEDVFVDDYIQLLEDANIDFDYNKAKYIIKSAYGKQFLYSIQNPNRAIGSSLTHAGFDEIDFETYKKAYDFFKKVVGRMRGMENAQIYIATSPDGFKTAYKIFITDKLGTIFRAKTTDNPHNPDSYIETMESIYDEKLILQNRDGEFININGLQAYHRFARNRHLMADKEPYKFKTNQLYIGIDFNIDFYSLVVSEMINGVLYVGREHRFANFNTFDAVKFIEDVYKDYAVIVCPDMTGGARKTSAVFTDLQILRQGKTNIGQFRIIGNSNPTQKDRINTVNNSLDKDKIRFHGSCEWLCGDFDKVVTDSYGFLDKSQETSGLVHMSDAFGYIVINLFPLSNRETLTRVG